MKVEITDLLGGKGYIEDYKDQKLIEILEAIAQQVGAVAKEQSVEDTVGELSRVYAFQTQVGGQGTIFPRLSEAYLNSALEEQRARVTGLENIHGIIYVKGKAYAVCGRLITGEEYDRIVAAEKAKEEGGKSAESTSSHPSYEPETMSWEDTKRAAKEWVASREWRWGGFRKKKSSTSGVVETKNVNLVELPTDITIDCLGHDVYTFLEGRREAQRKAPEKVLGNFEKPYGRLEFSFDGVSQLETKQPDIYVARQQIVNQR